MLNQRKQGQEKGESAIEGGNSDDSDDNDDGEDGVEVCTFRVDRQG